MNFRYLTAAFYPTAVPNVRPWNHELRPVAAVLFGAFGSPGRADATLNVDALPEALRLTRCDAIRGCRSFAGRRAWRLARTPAPGAGFI
jgi:hypothetical protein